MGSSAEQAPVPGNAGGGRRRFRAGSLRATQPRLGLQLVLILTPALLVLLGVSSWLSLRLHRQHLYAALESSAIGMGETILSSTHSSMLENDRHHLDQTIKNIGQREIVLALRLINAEGEVSFSSLPGDAGRVADIRAAACRGCHIGDTVLVPESVHDGLHLYSLPSGEKALGLAVPVLNSPECWEAACHVHSAERSVLGLLDLELSTAGLQSAYDAQRRQATIFSVGIVLIVCGVCAALAWRVVSRPVQSLVLATRRLATGDMDHRIPTTAKGELGELASSFNVMAGELQAAQHQLEEWGATLETRVAEKSRELERTRDQLVFTEKMASLGKLAAIVAHEINNPLAGVLVTSKLLRRRVSELNSSEASELPERLTRMDSSLAMIERETARCGDIVRNLLLFSRRRELSMAPEDINEILDRCLKLVGHQAELQAVEAREQLSSSLPHVMCDGAQIEQACLVMILNAIDAMPEGGVLSLRTFADPIAGSVTVEIGDTGVGIPKEIQNKIFEPFFSTKNDENGTGLGLAVLYGIVQRHRGSVDFDSNPERGTRFRIHLPIEPPAELDTDHLAGASPAERGS